MRRLPKLWRSLERITGLLAVPAAWEAECGEDFGFLRPHLRPTEMVGSLYPCPHHFGECPRKIVDYGDGEFAAICRDPYKSCDRIPLSPRDALLHDLDLASFLKPILQVASIRPEAPKPRTPGTWSLGLAGRSSSLAPAFLVVAHSGAAFEASVRDLLLDVSGQFLLVVPTNRYRSAEIQQRIQASSATCLCLEEVVGVDESGAFLLLETAESTTTARDQATPDRTIDRSVGSEAAVAAVRDYIAAKALTLTMFGNQFDTTDRTLRRFLKEGKMRRANFEAMADSIGVSSEQLLRGELPASIRRTARR
jgi:hypothetical protein